MRCGVLQLCGSVRATGPLNWHGVQLEAHALWRRFLARWLWAIWFRVLTPEQKIARCTIKVGIFHVYIPPRKPRWAEPYRFGGRSIDRIG